MYLYVICNADIMWSRKQYSTLFATIKNVNKHEDLAEIISWALLKKL